MPNTLRILDRKYLPYGLGLGAALVAALLVFLLSYFVVDRGRVEAEARALVTLDDLRVKLARELDELLTMPETMALFLGANPECQEDVFRAVAGEILSRRNEIISIVLAPDSVISTVYPLKGNEAIVGLEYLKIPDQAAAVQQAIEARHTVVAGPLRLKQGGFGVSSRTPVYRYTTPDAQKNPPYWGIVSLTLDADWLLQRAGFFKDAAEEFAIAVRGKDGKGKYGTVFGGKADLFEHSPITLDYLLPGGGVWEFGAVPVQGWPGFHSGTSIMLGLAYLLTGCIGYLSFHLAKRHQLMTWQASHDVLTGLPNRRALLENIDRMLLSAAKDPAMTPDSGAICGALCMLDLDKFKPVNDVYGHQAGDKLLQAVSQNLLALVGQASQVGQTSPANMPSLPGLVVRLGGDEFAVLLKTSLESASLRTFCQRILEELRKPVTLEKGDGIEEGVTVSISGSLGATFITVADSNLARLLARADKALYASKDAGKDTCTLVDAEGHIL